MISDFVKGRKQYDHSREVLIGIKLHREIDNFTDNHGAVKSAKEYFRPVYRLYSGAMVDVVFDHFLAIEPTVFSESSLAAFAEQVYSELKKYQDIFPDRFAYIFPYMKEQNWLFNYRHNTGIEIFQQNYQPLQQIFRQFWPDLAAFSIEKWRELQSST